MATGHTFANRDMEWGTCAHTVMAPFAYCNNAAALFLCVNRSDGHTPRTSAAAAAVAAIAGAAAAASVLYEPRRVVTMIPVTCDADT